MAISRNASLGRDRIVQDAGDSNLRFLPSRFAISGNPLDPAGGECLEFACPECHLGLSRATLTAEPLFTSLVGAPQAGKTFLLTAAVSELRRTLQALGCAFNDASPRENVILQEYAQRLQPQDPDALIAPLRPTDPAHPPNGVMVKIRGKDQRFLKPFQFHFRPNPDVSSVARSASAAGGRPGEGRPSPAAAAGSLLVLYDNPGEDFLAGAQDGIESARHVMHSRMIFFALNPLAERRMRERCHQNHPLVRTPPKAELRSECRQELVFSEIVSRVMSLKGLLPTESLGARVVVAITKSDLWPDMYKLLIDNRFWRDKQSDVFRGGVDWGAVDEVCIRAKELVRQVWPEFVSAADAADERRAARFFPVSILDPAQSGECVGPSGEFVIRARAVCPRWVEVPFLWALHRTVKLEAPASAPGTRMGGGSPGSASP